MRRAVFLDRDNTILANDGDLGDPALVRLLPGAIEAVRSLRAAGFVLVVVTNQGGVARGRYGEDSVHAVHRATERLLRDGAGLPRAIDLYLFCPHHPEAVIETYRREHPWRKPSPGMLLAAAEALDIDLHRSWMVGDAARDMHAGRRAGCRTVAITHASTDPDAVIGAADCAVVGLADAAALIIAESARVHDRIGGDGASDDA